ncbi:MAG: histidine phosphatase family protein [Planctomycetota bacterium]
MKHRLILMRHAKSDHADVTLADHDRVLADRGRRDTPTMAMWLAKHDLIPDRILSSTSARTRETVASMSNVWDEQPEVVYVESLYLASAETLLWTAREQHAEARSVMLLAHNPGVSMLASSLAGAMLPMPTAAIAVFTIASESGANPLRELNQQTQVQLEHYVTPKSLAAAPE